MEPADFELLLACAAIASATDVVVTLLLVTGCGLPSHKYRPTALASASAADASAHFGKAANHGARGRSRSQG